MTLIEVLMVLAVVLVAVAFILPRMLRPRSMAATRSTRIQCVNNLKQIGLAFRVWEGDNNDTYPMFVPETQGGAMEFTSGPNVWRQFQVMSNELSTPKILFCPVESDRDRFIASNFTWLNNSNLSYFAGIVSNEVNPQLILSGDHNITNGTALKNGVLELTASRPSGWTADMHSMVGNIGLSDGSVQQVSTVGLQTAVASVAPDTNRLQMPILSP
jgi:type II secretory pathway pseudopilin PulG